MDAGAIGSDTMSIVNLATSMQQDKISTQAQTSVLKTSMDMQKEVADQLIQSLGIGTKVNTEA